MIDLKLITLLVLCIVVFYIFIQVMDNKTEINNINEKMKAVYLQMTPQTIPPLNEPKHLCAMQKDSDDDSDYIINKNNHIAEYSNDDSPKKVLTTVTENESSSTHKSVVTESIPETESGTSSQIKTEENENKQLFDSSEKQSFTNIAKSADNIAKSADSIAKSDSSEKQSATNIAKSADSIAKSESSEKQLNLNELKTMKMEDIKKMAVKYSININKKINGAYKQKTKNELINELINTN
jgi:hypothetical protein